MTSRFIWQKNLETQGAKLTLIYIVNLGIISGAVDIFFYLDSSAMIVGSSYRHHHNERMKVHLADNHYYTSQNTLSQTELDIDPYKGLITVHC